MKQTQSKESAAKRSIKKNAQPSLKKVGTMLGTGAVAVLTIGAISVCSIADKTAIASKKTDTATECKTTVAYAAAKEDDFTVNASESSATVSWWKAGAQEYDFVEQAVTTAATDVASKATTTTKDTKKTTTTKSETSKSKATTTSDVKEFDVKNMYVIEDVNMRSGASKSYDVITVLDEDTKVSCDAIIDDGWYRVSYDGMAGYVMAEYLTDKSPSTTTKAKTTTAKKTTTKAKTTTASSDADVISYTDEEFNMMCYVLEAEVGGCTDASKIAVSNVIINRVNSSKFPNSIDGVLTAPNQFTAITNYYNKTKKPSSSTIDCAKRALQGEGAADSKGATFYYAPKYCGGSTAAWFETLTFCMELEGQRFFKN